MDDTQKAEEHAVSIEQADESRDWPCCEHCDHDPGYRHAGACMHCDFDLPDYDRQ